MDMRREIIKYRFSDPQKAYDICCELLEQGMQSGNDYEIAYAYLYMGDTIFSMGKPDQALHYMALAEHVQKTNGFDQLLMKTYNITGVIYINMGDALLAMDYYHAALNLAKKYENHTLEAMIYSNIGTLLTNIGDPAEAAGYYELAYDTSRKQGVRDNELFFNTVELYMNMCEVYLKEKDYTRAMHFLDDALDNIDMEKVSEPDRMRIAHAYAMIYYYLNDYGKAYEMCEKAISFCGLDWQEVEIFDDYMDITEILVDTGHLEQAGKLLRDMDEVVEQVDIENRRLKMCKIRIEICKKTGETDLLNEQLQIYYQARKKRNAERNRIVVAAINNRCRLEEEKKRNWRLNEDNKKLIKESEIDELTGIYNRFGFRRRYEKLYPYAKKKHQTYCVGIFDIDYFKQYNDSYGHLMGDSCLKQVARMLRKTSDGSFCIGRYGGDEFVFMANDVEEEDVRDFLGRLVKNIRDAHIPFESHQECGHVTISAGAALQNAAEDIDLVALLKKADQVLYEVKQTGKNGYKIRNFINAS